MKRVLPYVLGVTLLMQVNSVSASPNGNTNSRSINTITEQQNNTRGVVPFLIQESENRVTEYINKIQELELKIQEVDSQIIESMDKTEKLNEQVRKSEEKVSVLREELSKAEDSYNRSLELLKDHMRALQKTNKSMTMVYIEIILESKGLSDFISRANIISQIMQHSVNVTENLKTKEEELSLSKERLDKELEKLKTKRDESVQETEKIKELKETIERELEQLETLKAEEDSKIAEELARREAESLALQNYYSNLNLDIDYELFFTEETVQNVQTVITESFKYLGTPYVWGGTTPNGFDCSGLMQYIYKEIGVKLPRVARDQQNYGQIIPLSEIKAGDMIFIGYPATHVGMYIGDGKYIHAPRTGDVVKVTKYYPQYFTSATRVIIPTQGEKNNETN